ncbi:hypothetical protein [Insolitispirillum peregrinum]|nr:hypothetical protein [Insolitispirillum peregrinum]
MSHNEELMSGVTVAAQSGIGAVDGYAGAEVARLATEFGSLLSMLAKQRGNEKLASETGAFITVQKGRMTQACSSCAQSLQRSASLYAEMQHVIELPVPNRRTDFLLRMVLAFYPYGFSDRLHPGTPLALPRTSIGRVGRFLNEVLGTLPYADLNADCSRLISRFPDVADRELRSTMFAHKASRLLLMKVLIRLLNGFHDLALAEEIFMQRVGGPAHGSRSAPVNGKAKPQEHPVTEEHFRALCEGLFGEFVLQLQNPREGDDLEAWFGVGAPVRVLDLLEQLAAQTRSGSLVTGA